MIDIRLDEINFVIDKIKERRKKGKLKRNEYIVLEKRLNAIGRKKPSSRLETTLLGGKKELRGLSFRTFRRWLTAYMLLGDTYHWRYLVREIQRNPDYRLTRKLVTLIRAHPRVSGPVSRLMKFIESDLNLFPHQHAEILWAFRYLSRIPQRLIEHCQSLVLDENKYFYVRVSAAQLLSRVILDKKFLDECRSMFHQTANVNVRIGIGALLMQSTGSMASKTLRMLVFHPDERIASFGKLLREVRYDFNEAKNRLKYLVRAPHDGTICDNMALLFSMTHSPHIQILDELLKFTSGAASSSSVMDLRGTLHEIRARAEIQKNNLQRAKS